MKYHHYTHAILLLAVVFAAQTLPSASARVVYPTQWLDGEVQHICDTNQLMGLSLAVVDPAGETVYDNAYGYANLARGTNATRDTYYRIMSISKTVTTIALMTLFDEGKFALDDDISDILGFSVRNPHFPDVPITVAAVLSHTSSLHDGDTYLDFVTDTQDAAQGADIPHVSALLVPGGQYYSDTNFQGHAPGTYFEYCNLNFGIAGTLVERLSGELFDAYAQRAVLSRLNMTASYNVADIAAWEDIATIYVAQDDGEWRANLCDYAQKPPQRNMTGYMPGTNGFEFAPQAGLFARLRDLTQIVRVLAYGGAVRGTVVLKPETVQLMLNPQWVYNGTNGDSQDGLMRAYGLGVMITTLARGQDVIWPHKIMKGHTGFGYGLASNLFFDPVSRAGFVLASNGERNGYHRGTNSSFILFEQQLQQAVYEYLFGDSGAVTARTDSDN